MHKDYAFAEVWNLVRNVDWDDGAFSTEKAYCLALFSELAYYHISSMETNASGRVKLVPCSAFQRIISERHTFNVAALLSNYDIREPIVIPGKYVVTFAFSIDDIVFVAVRGTERAYDWRFNLNTLPKRRNGLVFHRGFLNEALNQLPELSDALVSLRPNATRIYFTGHSLGGAVAAIFFSFLCNGWGKVLNSNQKILKAGAYTFGMPRFAGRRSLTRIATPHHVLRNGDVVPNIPPERLGFGTCSDEFAPQGHKAIRNTDITNYPYWIYTLLSFKFLDNHDMVNYRKDLAEAIGINSPDMLLPYDRKKWPGARR